MKNDIILKLTGMVILTMIALVVISILEVTVYSYLINPGQDASVYDAHAESSAPYISCIFGFIIFFFVARHWKKRGYHNVKQLVVLFPLTYVVVDGMIITLAGVQWSSFVFVFILANGAKCLGGCIGYIVKT